MELPRCIDSEEIVLGAMLNNQESFRDGIDSLGKEDFFVPYHQQIFSLLRQCYDMDVNVDISTFLVFAKERSSLDQIGGQQKVFELCDKAGLKIYLKDYIAVLRKKSNYRKIFKITQKAQAECLRQGLPDEELITTLQKDLHHVFVGLHDDLGRKFSEILDGTAQGGFFKKLQERQELCKKVGRDNMFIGDLHWGYKDLDRLIDGMTNSNFMVLGARPSMGKTAFALNVVLNVAKEQNKSVAFFSLEMSDQQLAQRLLAAEAQVGAKNIKWGDVSTSEFHELQAAYSRLEEKKIIIDQNASTIQQIKSKSRLYKESYEVDFIVIDYLQLISGNSNAQSREREIGEISRELKILAKELNIPIFCLSQLSRKVDDRPGHRPVLGDLRESGTIEQDADLVLFLLRKSYYDKEDQPGMGQIIVAKNRHGEIGDVDLVFINSIAKFKDYHKEY